MGRVKSRLFSLPSRNPLVKYEYLQRPWYLTVEVVQYFSDYVREGVSRKINYSNLSFDYIIAFLYIVKVTYSSTTCFSRFPRYEFVVANPAVIALPKNSDSENMEIMYFL